MHEEVFPHLVDTYYTALYRFALSLAKNASDAGDLTQQTFFVWATKGHTLRDSSKAKTWLFTTLYREFLRSRRRSSRDIAIEDLPPGEQDLPQFGTDVVSKMDAQLVLEALQEVDQTFREPLALFYLQTLSYLEIAEVLDVPVGTVMSRLSRGKTQLRTLLAAKASRAEAIVSFPLQGARS